MGISDRNEIIYLAYDSVVEFENEDYTVIARSNISNPVVSYLMYELELKGAKKYLWYDKKNHKIAMLDRLDDASAFSKEAFRLELSDKFQRQIEKKEGAPLLYSVAVEIYASADGASMAVAETLNGARTVYAGRFVKPVQITIYPYNA